MRESVEQKQSTAPRPPPHKTNMISFWVLVKKQHALFKYVQTDSVIMTKPVNETSFWLCFSRVFVLVCCRAQFRIIYFLQIELLVNTTQHKQFWNFKPMNCRSEVFSLPPPALRALYRNRSFLRIPLAARPRFSSLRSLRFVSPLCASDSRMLLRSRAAPHPLPPQLFIYASAEVENRRTVSRTEGRRRMFRLNFSFSFSCMVAEVDL